MSSVDAEVIIVGGGLAGNTLAALLASKGVQCIVIEAGEQIKNQKSEHSDPRALAITHASRRILESIGVWQQLPAEKVGRFSAMHVWDENGQGEIEFDSGEICQPSIGNIIEQSVLQASLEQVVDNMPGITVHNQLRLRDLEWQEDSISAVLDDDQKLSAQLIVAADGVQSESRRLAGINNKVHDYQQVALACIVTTALPHENIARQRFLTNGPLAFLPMHNAFQCGIVWSSTPEQAEELMQMPPTEFNRALQRAFEQTLGEVLESEGRACFPLRRAQAEQYCKTRFALVGDAAHSVHPLAGQGANLSLLDVASLAQLVLQAKQSKRDIASTRVLRDYERWRKLENLTMMMTLESFKYSFENQNSPMPILRNTALDFANSIIPLKNTIMRHAMGLAGDLPELAKTSLV